MALLFNIVAALLSLLLLLYFLFARRFRYWADRGIPGPKPTFFFGNIRDVILQRESPGDFLDGVYKSFPGSPVAGMYFLSTPTLLLRDPEVIKNCLVKDFPHFLDHYTQSSKDKDPLMAHGLFMLRGLEWKYMRSKLSPIFTPGRLKKMFYLLLECGTQLKKEAFRIALSDNNVVEVKELMGKTSTDVITTCAFGINSNCISDPNAEFSEFGKAIFDFTFMTSFTSMAIFFLPWLAELAGFKVFPLEATEFLRKVFWDTLVAREESKTCRNDLIDQLIQLKNKGKMDDEERENSTKETTTSSDKSQAIFDFTGDDLLAQAGFFYITGFETSSSTLAFTLYDIAMHIEVQDRVRREVNQVMARHGGQITYEGVSEMKYLEMVISESLRKHPTLPFLDRQCVQDYKLPGTDLVIEKGTPIYVSLLGLHNDPKYFPDPDTFDPERFSEENRQHIPAHTYMPFGEGPRICIGMKFALMAMKTQLASILSHIEVTPCAATPIPLVFNPQGSLLTLAHGGIPLKFRHV